MKIPTRIAIKCHSDDEIKTVLTWLDDLNAAYDNEEYDYKYGFVWRSGDDPLGYIPRIEADDTAVIIFVDEDTIKVWHEKK